MGVLVGFVLLKEVLGVLNHRECVRLHGISHLYKFFLLWGVGFEVVGRVVVAIVVKAGMLFVDAVEIEIFSINDANAVVGTEEGIGALLAE